MTVGDHLVGETTLLVEARDQAGQRLTNPGKLIVRGDMHHAGMAPVISEAENAVDGVFSLPFEWTMAGGWIVEARLSLADGSVASQTFRYQILNEASEPMEMEHAHEPSQPSAAYMRVSNRGESEIRIVAASSPAAMNMSFHETVIEDGQATMKALPELRIPPGQTLELKPGGKHIMLMGLTSELAPGRLLLMELESARGDVYALEIPVMTMQMDAPREAMAIGDLEFSGLWARPASAGMSMNATRAP